MEKNTPCPTCGKSLPADAPMGICPDCLLSAGFGTVTRDERAEKLRSFEPPLPEEIAARFPQLEISELLGRGGMGAVYKARQTELDRTVALKILPPSIGDEPSFAERFAREAKALAKLNHPGIVTIYEFGRADGLFYFLMEFVDGVNLRQLLQGDRIAPREALAIVPQICDALQFAHDHGIVHRDIKPENILMDRRGRVKVADFGIAKLTGTEEQILSEPGGVGSAFTEAGKVIGTPSYMAPEQTSNPAGVDHRADIYALGVVFYQMLTGELPHKRVEAPSTKVAIDVRLDEVVMRALEKKPEMRYQRASALKTEVETIVQSGSVDFSHAGTVSGLAALGTHAASLPEGDAAGPGWSSGPFPTSAPWAERHRGMPKRMWLPILVIVWSVASNLRLPLGHSHVSLIANVLFAGLLLFGFWVQSRIAYMAVVVATFWWVPTAVSLSDLPLLLVNLLLTVAIVVPVVWSTSWFFPPEMPAVRKQAWFWSTVVLSAIAMVSGFALPRSAVLFNVAPPPDVKESSDGGASSQDKVEQNTSGAAFQKTGPKFTATLPDGSFVELVSLQYGPGSDPRRTQGSATNIIDFWKPDGTRNEEYGRWSFGPGTLSSRHDPSLEFRGMIARWGGPDTNNVRLMSWQLDDNQPDSADGQFTVTPKDESAENWIGLVQGFPQDKKTAVIRFALASGPYTTGPKPKYLWSSSDKTPYGSFSIGKIFDHNGNAAVTLTHSLKGCDYRLRTHIPEPQKPTSALGKLVWNWKQKSRRDQYQPVYGRIVKGGAFNQTFEFPGVPAKEAMSKLPRIGFEVRPLQWVEFQNVALNPGEQTRLQIRVLGEAASLDQEQKSSVAAPGSTAGTAPDAAKSAPVVEATVDDLLENAAQEQVDPTPGQAGEEPRSAPQAQRDAGTVGGLIERVLPDPDNGDGKTNLETLHLRTGRTLSALAGAPKEGGGRLGALAASEGDLFLEFDDVASKRWTLAAVGLKLSDFPAGRWDTATTAEVMDVLKHPTAL